MDSLFEELFRLYKGGNHQTPLLTLAKVSRERKLSWKLRHLYLMLIAEEKPTQFNQFSRNVPLKDHPNRPGLYFDLANIFLRKQQPALARQLFKKSLSINASYLEAKIGLAKSLLLEKNYLDAEKCNKEVEAGLQARQFETLQIASKLRYWANDFDAALDYSERSVDLVEKAPTALLNHGVILADLRRFDESIPYYHRALELRPDYEKAHQYLGQVYLHKGMFKEGWDHYRWRWKNSDFPSGRIQTNRPMWDPRSKTAPTRLLVWGEQGLGEQILFGRMLDKLSKESKSVSVQIDPRLIPLYIRRFPKVQFFSKESVFPESEYDEYITFADLSIRYITSKSDLTRLSRVLPTLASDDSRKGIIKGSLARDERKLCGLSWRSVNTQYGKLKSLGLIDILKEIDIDAYQFVSLQYGNVEREICKAEERFGIKILRCNQVDNLRDLEGLTTLIKCCDVVLSTSNVTVHLAGAIGVPTIMLQPFGKTLWFWDHRAGMESWWYPSVKVVSQFDHPSDWWQVVRRMLSE